MIFVTVGTHEQPFDRLLKGVNSLKRNKELANEDIIVQTGYSQYVPKNCRSQKFFSYDRMLEYVKQARIVITHGGPSSFIMPLQVGKIPIVVPRLSEFNEHVNDHQLDFALEVEKRKKNIIVVEEMADLESKILNYNSIIKDMNFSLESNNQKFNQKLEKIITELF